MKKNIFITITAVSLFLTGCGNSFYDAQNYLTGPVDGIGVKKATSIIEGSQEQLFAVVTPPKTKNKDVTWKSSDPSIASVDQNGTVSGIGVGYTIITATTVEGGYTDTCEVTITVKPVPVTGITLNKVNSWLCTGGIDQLTADVSPTNATNQNITWSSDDAAIAAVDQNGLVTARTSGTTSITAKTVDGGIKAICVYTVTDAPVPVTGLSLNKLATVIETGSSERLYALITPFNATTSNVIWSSSNTDIAKVNSLGTVTGASDGTARITATSIDNGSCVSYCDCTIVSGIVAVSKIALNKTSTMILADYSEQLEETITPSNATNQNIIWSSSNNSVASVDSSGKVTAISNGSAVITVTSVDGNKTASCTCIVSDTDISVESVSLNKESTTIEIKKSEQLYASVSPVLAKNKAVTWTSSDTSIAVVDNNGTITGKKAGTSVISVISDDGKKTDSCICTISEGTVPIEAVAIPAALTIKKGSQQPLTLTFTPSGATNRNVIWTSSDESIATVDDSGIVTGISKGSAEIEVISADGKKSDTCLITVQVAVESIVLTPDPFTITTKNGTSSITVTYTPSDANTGLVTSWKSLNPEIATVNAAGTTIGVSFGSAQIVATYGNGTKTAECVLSVAGFRLKYNGNGGVGDLPASSMIQNGTIVTVPGQGNLVKAGSSFLGWCESSDGTGTTYTQGQSFTMGNSNKNLYAKWALATCKITFYPNGGDSGSTPVQNIPSGTGANLTANGFSKAGYTFAGWSKTINGSVEYTDGTYYTIGITDISLYAKWIPNNNHLIYNSGYGLGSMTDQIISTGSSAYLKPNTFTRDNYTFMGWATDAGSQSPVVYTDGVLFTMGTSNTTLYAKWSSNHVYVLRETGPAGGIIFYDKGDYSGGWRYLEAAPAGWYGAPDPTVVWSNLCDYYTNNAGTTTGIGTGCSNTEKIVNQVGHTDSGAKLCKAYSGSGFSDWFMPSKDELSKMFINLKSGTDENSVIYTPLSGFNAGAPSGTFYWCSSESGGNIGQLQVFDDPYGSYGVGSQSYTMKNSGSYYRIRPVRAF